MNDRVTLVSAEPTVFFVRDQNGLRQRVRVTVENTGDSCEAALMTRLGGDDEAFPLGHMASGRTAHDVYVRDVRTRGTAQFRIDIPGSVESVLEMPWNPVRHWEVHLVHGSHHDLGYTDLPSNVLRQHDSFLDRVVQYCEETADFPDESRFRYVIEQGWSALHYIDHRPPPEVDRLVRLMREGRIEVTALFGNETSELCGHEEQIRLTYPSFRIKRRFGIPIQSAELNDVPGLSWGLVSVLAGAGIRYFAPGLPDYFRWGYTVHPFWDELKVLERDMPGAFWWEGPDGSRVLFWYGRHAGLWAIDQAEEELGTTLGKLSARSYPYDVIRLGVIGGHRDNAPVDVRFSLIAREWNERWAYPRLIVSTNTMFFEQFERAYGSRLPVLRGELPNTDYTVGATSTARTTGVNRITHDVLASGEKFATCASVSSDYEYPADVLAEAYDSALLYDEHTWGMAHPVGPAQDGCWAQKAQYAFRAAALAHDVLSKSVNRIADQVNLEDAGYQIVVFNALARERTGLVNVPATPPAPCGRPMHWQSTEGQLLDSGQPRPPVLVSGTAIGRSLIDLPLELLESPFELVDLSTGRSVPYQILSVDDPMRPRSLAPYNFGLGAVTLHDGSRAVPNTVHRKSLVFVAEGVPGLGYKTFRIAPTSAWPIFETSLQVSDNWIENRFYVVRLDPQSGAVVSVWDKELEREWVDASAPHGFGLPVMRWAATGEEVAPKRSIIERGDGGPVAASLLVRGLAETPLPGFPQRTQEITLYDTIKRIDFGNRMLKDPTPLIELYFAFPYAVNQPDFRLETSNAVLAPLVDQLPGSNTDNYAVQHWVSTWDAEGAVTWSSLEAPVVAIGGLWPGYVSQAHHGATGPGYGHEFLSDPAELRDGHIYSLALASNFRTNFQPVQTGDVLFRYAMTSHAGDWRDGRSRDFGEDVSAPLYPVCIRGRQTGRLAVRASFCRLSAANVSLLTFKAAEDGDGVVVRVAETEGLHTQVDVELPYVRIGQAYRTNLVEEDQEILPYDAHTVRVELRPYQIATVRCRTGRRWPAVTFFARH
ncbi:MAG: hypothetical protein GX620_04460 [Chloroflexi bacterium]|nr:hypothetical protein [Chloroflexota bacterium]